VRGLCVRYIGESCKNKKNDRDAVCWQTHVGPRYHVLDGNARWCHLKNTTEQSVRGGDTALCQFTLIAYLLRSSVLVLAKALNFDLNFELRYANKISMLSTKFLTAERRVPELIQVLGSQPAGDVSHKHGGILPLLSTRPAVTLATLKRDATNFAAW